ncbi:hypothetical protein NQZ68_002756 [Dissostichus eleginoides]|nr:hypothetical protein NQZ68_002756 [Dissostichus eleginoides]
MGPSLLHLIAVFVAVHVIQCQAVCNRQASLEWHAKQHAIQVNWTLVGNICRSVSECWNSPGGEESTTPVSFPQICPLQLQHGDKLLMSADETLKSYGFTLLNVSKDEFESCSTNGQIKDQFLFPHTINGTKQVEAKWLVPGHHYFIALHEGETQLCKLGLRLNVVLLCFGFVRGAVFVKQASGMVRTAVDATTTTLGVFVKTDSSGCFGIVMVSCCPISFLGVLWSLCCIHLPAVAHLVRRGKAPVIQIHAEMAAFVSPPPKDLPLIVSVPMVLWSQHAGGFRTCAAPHHVSTTPPVCPGGMSISAGWIGEFCQYVGDACLIKPNSCLNGATCITTSQPSSPPRYTCKCPHGFTGTNCETEINECDSSPCQHNGTCSDLLGHHQCQCPAVDVALAISEY